MIIELGYSNSALADKLLIPDWIKNKTSWWSNGQIWESNYISTLQYLDNQSTSIPITKPIATDEKIFDSDKSSFPIVWPEEVFGIVTRLSLRDSTGDQIPPSFRVTFESTEFPLTINGTNYRLDQIKNVTLTKVEIGKPLKLQIRMYENEGTANVQHVMLYLNQHGPKILNDLTETGITYEKGKNTQIIDPDNLIENATITQSIEGYKNVFEFEVKFSKKMDTSDLLFRIWDYPRNSVDMYIPNALVVTDTSASLKNIQNNVLQESVAKLNDTERINLKPSLPENKIPTPLKQFKDRNHLDDITCKEGMMLVIKTINGFPACVKPETKIKLIDRKWASDIVNNLSNYTDKFLSKERKKTNQTDFTNSIPLTLFPVTPQNVTLPDTTKKTKTDTVIISINKTNQVKITNLDSTTGQKTHLAQLLINSATLYTKDIENLPTKSGFNTLIFDYTVQNKDNEAFYPMFDFELQFGSKKYPTLLKGEEVSEILHPGEKRNSSFAVQVDKAANEITLNIKDSLTKKTLWAIPLDFTTYKTKCRECQGNLIGD
jgi:hypothetical protein